MLRLLSCCLNKHDFGLPSTTQVESEAAALSRLGLLFYKVLKLKSKAKENFMRCMQLALAMTPRFPENEGEIQY